MPPAPGMGATMAELLSLSLLAAGVFFFAAGTVALLRFPDTLTRLHALTKADNLGLGLIVLGLALRTTQPAEAGVLLLIWLLALTASGPVGSLLGGVAARQEPKDRRS